jgi:uncharacterized membrane protein
MASIADTGGDRSISVGRVFQLAFATIRHNPGPTLGLAFLFGALPGLAVTYFMERLQTQAITVDPASAMPGGLGAFYSLILLSAVAGLVIAALTQAVLTRTTVAEAEGRRASFSESIKAGFGVLLPLIALSILLAVGVMLGFILLIVPGIILYVMWSVAVPALVEERPGIFGAFARSRELTRGARWKIFGILLILLVVYWLVSGAVGLFGLSTASAQPNVVDMPTGLMVVSILVGTLINLFWGTVQAALYVELRDCKDGPATENLERIFS